MCDIAIKRYNEWTTNGVYFESMLYPWDYAAASLIVMEAGGFISMAEGGMITLD
ncbi:MAG: hypothetical protein ACLRQ3_06895 [Dorea sp.]